MNHINVIGAPFVLSENPSYYYPPIYACVFQVVPSPQVSPPTLHAPLLSPTRATCPAHLILSLITRIMFGERYRALRFALCSYSPVTSYLLSPNILLSNLFSNTLSLSSSVIISDQVSHPYKQQAKL